MSLASSLASAFRKEGPVQAGMAFWDSRLGIEVPGSLQAFQYFPEKISDSRSVEYASKMIPGGSHPIYTFISGGERGISFEAIFTNENKGLSIKDNPYSVDIPKAIGWLRQATYPIISRDGISSPPPLVVLYFPKSGITKDGWADGGSSLIGIITAANVSYEALHRDGTPRITVVSVDFKEVVQTEKNWGFVSGTDLNSAYIKPFNKMGIF